jgi:NADH:ubiquinone oxidoreductase subunit 2 (subunit N)
MRYSTPAAGQQIKLSGVGLQVGLVALHRGLAFKLGAVPFSCTVYQGAPTAVTALIGGAAPSWLPSPLYPTLTCW